MTKPSAARIDEALHARPDLVVYPWSRAERMRAAKLLRDNLTTGQAQALVKDGRFHVDLPAGYRRPYVVVGPRGTAGIIRGRSPWIGRPENVPRADWVLACKLLVELEPRRFVAMSCMY